MKIEIKIRPYDAKIGDERWVILSSVLNSDTLVALAFEGVKVVVDGAELASSINRITGRPFANKD